MPGKRQASGRRAAVPLARAASAPALDLAQILPSGRSLALGFALLALAGGGYLGARESSAFAVRAIEVEGVAPGEARRVRTALAPLLGRSLLRLDSAEVERRLERLPQVRTAGYDRDFPNTLRVFVRAERSVALLHRGSESWLVSARGYVLRPPRGRLRRRLPHLWVPRGVELRPGSAVRTGEAARSLRTVVAVQAFTPGLFGEVAFVRGKPDELTVVLRSRIEVRLGDESALGLKLAVARRVLPALAPAAEGAAPGYLDVSVPARPVAGPIPQP